MSRFIVNREIISITITLVAMMIMLMRKDFNLFFILVTFCFFSLAFFMTISNLLRLNSSHYLVLEAHPSWIILTNGPHRYFMKVEVNHGLAFGDVLTIQGKPIPLMMNTYESRFNFLHFLNDKGINHELIDVRLHRLFSFPLRIEPLLSNRLNRLPLSIQPFVSEMLFNRIDEGYQLHQATKEWIGISGFGFYLTFQLLDKLLAPWFSNRIKDRVKLFFFLPYVLMSLSRWGIVRVYVLEVIRFMTKKNPEFQIKVFVMLGLSFFNPYTWTSLSFYAYLYFQALMQLLSSILKNSSPLKRWMVFSIGGFAWTWISTGKIQLFQTLLYLPISIVQAALMPSWLIYFYSGVQVPLAREMTLLLLLIIESIPKLPDLALGILPFYTLILLVMLGITILYARHLHLKQYERISLSFLFLVLILHVIGVDQYGIDRVHFINVGQGDATLVQSRKRTLLIDTGGIRTFDIAKEVIIPYLKRHRIHHLDHLIITHDDFDHNGGKISLMNNIPVHSVIENPFNSFTLGSFMIRNYQDFLNEFHEDNDRSLIIGIQMSSCQWLIMGDAGVAVEAKLMDSYPALRASILRIGHHGSDTSTSAKFLDHIQPKEVVISNGGKNRYGHPHQEVLKRIQERQISIRRTDLEGTIRYQTCKIRL